MNAITDYCTRIFCALFALLKNPGTGYRSSKDQLMRKVRTRVFEECYIILWFDWSDILFLFPISYP